MGDSTASPVAATITWLMKGKNITGFRSASSTPSNTIINKLLIMSIIIIIIHYVYPCMYTDGLGMVGRIVFAWLKG